MLDTNNCTLILEYRCSVSNARCLLTSRATVIKVPASTTEGSALWQAPTTCMTPRVLPLSFLRIPCSRFTRAEKLVNPLRVCSVLFALRAARNRVSRAERPSRLQHALSWSPSVYFPRLWRAMRLSRLGLARHCQQFPLRRSLSRLEILSGASLLSIRSMAIARQSSQSGFPRKTLLNRLSCSPAKSSWFPPQGNARVLCARCNHFVWLLFLRYYPVFFSSLVSRSSLWWNFGHFVLSS